MYKMSWGESKTFIFLHLSANSRSTLCIVHTAYTTDYTNYSQQQFKKVLWIIDKNRLTELKHTYLTFFSFPMIDRALNRLEVFHPNHLWSTSRIVWLTVKQWEWILFSNNIIQNTYTQKYNWSLTINFKIISSTHHFLGK